MVAFAQAVTTSEPMVKVRPHPHGGWTHAWLGSPGVSSCRVYRGWWPSERAAQAALRRVLGPSRS